MKRIIPIVLFASLVALSPKAASVTLFEETQIEPPVVFQELENPNWRVERISHYQALRGQTDSDPEISACGRTKSAWKQVAVSRDLLKKVGGCGAKIRIDFDNGKSIEFVVFDTMNARYKNTVDILVGEKEPARKYGIVSGRIELIECGRANKECF